MPEGTPFCFRCGGQPECQIELFVPDDVEGKREIGVWPLCVACVKAIDDIETWGDFLGRLVEQDQEAVKERECPRCNGTGDPSIADSYGEEADIHLAACDHCRGTGCLAAAARALSRAAQEEA